MGVRIRYRTTRNQFPSMEQNIRILDGKKINVGVKGEQAWLAAIHEYGCKIRITPKMRKWLSANGLHVKDSTTEITIPERSFLRSGFDKNHIKVIEKAERTLGLVISGDMNVNMLYDLIGTLLRDAIKEYAIDLNAPPKHPFTLQRNPGKTNPLIQSGDMVNFIEFEVE